MDNQTRKTIYRGYLSFTFWKQSVSMEDKLTGSSSEVLWLKHDISEADWEKLIDMLSSVFRMGKDHQRSQTKEALNKLLDTITERGGRL